MPISDLPILSMLRTRMHWHQERQRVLSENVANADTPNFRPRDLTQPDFSRGTLPQAVASGVALARTDPGHFGGTPMSNPSRFPDPRRGGYEVRPTGNAVNLEDEMIKVAANQMDYQAATTLYTKSLGLIKIAIGKR
jgi:flagellar basal-body rod protein FlgB